MTPPRPALFAPALRLALGLLCAAGVASAAEPELHNGKHGAWWVLAPAKAAKPAQALVLLHGAISNPEQANGQARGMVDAWRADADKLGLVLVAPVFDDARYGSMAGPGGGYRSLFGREVGADQFLEEAVAEALGVLPAALPKLYLFGHSAGAQAALRYVVRHPERVAAVVASSPGSYAFPDKDLAWPEGMKAVKGQLPWKGVDPAPVVEVKPDPAGWAQAALLPVTVIIGEKDSVALPRQPPGKPTTRSGLAQAWVTAMVALVAPPAKSGVRLIVLPGEPHGSPAMRDRAAQELAASRR